MGLFLSLYLNKTIFLVPFLFIAGSIMGSLTFLLFKAMKAGWNKVRSYVKMGG